MVRDFANDLTALEIWNTLIPFTVSFIVFMRTRSGASQRLSGPLLPIEKPSCYSRFVLHPYKSRHLSGETLDVEGTGFRLKGSVLSLFAVDRQRCLAIEVVVCAAL